MKPDTVFTFDNGIKIRQLSETSYEQIDLLDRHICYLRAEHVVIEPTLQEQRIKPVKPALSIIAQD